MKQFYHTNDVHSYVYHLGTSLTVSQVNESGYTPLTAAAAAGSIEVCREILRFGLDRPHPVEIARSFFNLSKQEMVSGLSTVICYDPLGVTTGHDQLVTH